MVPYCSLILTAKNRRYLTFLLMTKVFYTTSSSAGENDFQFQSGLLVLNYNLIPQIIQNLTWN